MHGEYEISYYAHLKNDAIYYSILTRGSIYIKQPLQTLVNWDVEIATRVTVVGL